MPEIPLINHRPDGARVAVVAAGIVSPLGFGLDETLTALREGRDCVSPVTSFPVEHCRCKTAGQVADDRLAGAGQSRLRSERLHRVCSTANRVTGVTQSRPSRSASSVSPNPKPSGLTIPAATTATRVPLGRWLTSGISGISQEWRTPSILFAFTGKSLY